MAKAVCSECGCSIEYTKGEDFAYCPMCENDQVEIKLSFDTILFNNLFKYTKHNFDQKVKHKAVEKVGGESE